MAAVDKEYAERLTWLLRWQDRMDELVKDGIVTYEEFARIEREVLDEVYRLRDLRRRRIEEVR
jgi:hypothetical protein